MLTCIVVVYFIKSSLKKANFTAEEKWHFSQTCVHCIFIFSIKIAFSPSHDNISKGCTVHHCQHCCGKFH